MDDVRPSPASKPLGIERYTPGEPSSDSSAANKKPLPPLPARRIAPETPEVEEDDSRHQLDERA